MDKQQAQQLIKNTFEDTFDKGRFILFAKIFSIRLRKINLPIRGIIFQMRINNISPLWSVLVNTLIVNTR